MIRLYILSIVVLLIAVGVAMYRIMSRIDASAPAALTEAATTRVSTTPETRVVTVTRTVKGDCVVRDVDSGGSTTATSSYVPAIGAGSARPNWSLGLSAPVSVFGSPRAPWRLDGAVRLGGTPVSLDLGLGLDGSVSVGGRIDLP